MNQYSRRHGDTHVDRERVVGHGEHGDEVGGVGDVDDDAEEEPEGGEGAQRDGAVQQGEGHA